MNKRFSTKLAGLFVLICTSSLSFAARHTVKQGDTLYGLSKKYEISIEQIKSLNNLKGDKINFGQVLVIQPEKLVAPAAPSVPDAPEVVKPSIQKETSHLVSGLDALQPNLRVIAREQILLDRNGMGPGVIDGHMGDFTKTAKELAVSHRPNALSEDVPLLVERLTPSEAFTYLNVDLPGTGKRPDFKTATEQKSLMMYKSSLEMLAERYHSSEEFLEKINPDVDFKTIVTGQKILVPNVAEFKIETFMTPEGKAVKYNYLRKTRRATRVDIDYGRKRIMVYHNSGKEGASDVLLAAFPVTTNIKEGPTSQRVIEYFAPAPTYMRKKTQLDLRPGPNSPVGIVWGRLGDGYGIHGTSDGAGNGYNTSSGCIRLSNWDMAIFVKIVPAKISVNFLLNGVVLNPIIENVKQDAVVDKN